MKQNHENIIMNRMCEKIINIQFCNTSICYCEHIRSDHPLDNNMAYIVCASLQNTTVTPCILIFHKTVTNNTYQSYKTLYVLFNRKRVCTCINKQLQSIARNMSVLLSLSKL